MIWGSVYSNAYVVCFEISAERKLTTLEKTCSTLIPPPIVDLQKLLQLTGGFIIEYLLQFIYHYIDHSAGSPKTLFTEYNNFYAQILYFYCTIGLS